MTKTKTVTLGLVEGRHELPVDDFFFKEGDITFPLQPDKLYRTVENKIDSLNISVLDDTYVTVYATGLTAALTAVIKFCYEYKFHLTVKHFDRDTGGWIDDVIFR